MTTALVETAAPEGELSQQQVYMQVIHKMLTDEPRFGAEPSINTAMVNVLSDDLACAVFVSYITRIAGHDVQKHAILDGPQPVPLDGSGMNPEAQQDPLHNDEEASPEVIASYRATMLLTNDDSSEALLTFLGKKSKLLTKCMFPIFQRNAQGLLRHGCRVIDHLMRLYLDDVYEVIGRNAATTARYMDVLLDRMEDASVSEVLLTLICKPHNANVLRFYASTPQTKWQFFRALAEYKILLVLAQHVYGDGYSELHNIAAADVFVELVDRLSADENGALLLQPAAYCPELLEGLIRVVVATSSSKTNGQGPSHGQRTAAMKCVLRLLQRSILDKVQGPPTSPYQSFGSTVVNLLPNQLMSLRDKIFELAEKDMGKMLRYLIDKYQDQQNIEMDLASPDKPLPQSAVRHTAYVVKVPFTEFRLMLVDALVEIVAHNPSTLSAHFDANVWRVLLAWFFEYAHNNLYHAAFYQLVFIALRTDNQVTLEILIKKLKLVTALIEYYRDETVNTSNKGYILQCCNAIRLQAASQPPDAFLRNFLKSHITWRGFEPELRAHTTRICNHGLGFNVPQSMRPGTMYQRDTWQTIGETKGIDHGSEYARTLGFLDDVAWPDDHDGDDLSSKKKKKKKGKKKASGHGGSAANGNEDGDGDDGDDGASSVASSSTVGNGHHDSHASSAPSDADSHDEDPSNEDENGHGNGNGAAKKSKSKKKKKKSKK
jgi:hypothetical protein